MLLASSSLLDGFVKSNFIGQALVLVQLLGSVIMVATIIGKIRQLSFYSVSTRRFLRDFATYGGVLDYYLQAKPNAISGAEGMYAETCERLLKLLSPDERSLLSGREPGRAGAALSAREVELVRGTCEHALDEEEIRIEHGMGVIATIVALEPMLGLLGTVWGVLDAFYLMAQEKSASLIVIAPSISSALVTTVVGLIIAIPGVIAFNRMNASIRNITADMEGFADELTSRIACEYQGRGA